ncbi:DUF6225 family protein [Streptomyces sp. 1222.5]|uniref:DUF6225 family protein n=1 Tax=Streptomyces sp. 1222.5 TaxID=1881026 RepID=UPI003EBC2015
MRTDGPGFSGRAWSVGTLRRALDGIPDETPVILSAECEPGSTEEFIIVNGELRGAIASLNARPPKDSELILQCRLPNHLTAGLSSKRD